MQDTEITAANAAALSNKLCQMSNGAIYDDDGEIIPIHNRKLDALEDIIESANGKPVLVAYWFKHDRTRIAERLHKLGIVYQEIKSAESIKKWNSGKLQAALIHPASAGHGLNLQSGGNFLVWFGLTWSLETVPSRQTPVFGGRGSSPKQSLYSTSSQKELLMKKF